MQGPSTDNWRVIHESGHRNFVGGDNQYWELVGSLQFDFLTAQGLKPEHTLFDVGCGSLRGGLKFIQYLEVDRYVGIDKHIELIIYGVAIELGTELFRAKRPRFSVTDTFEFEKIGVRADFAIAQSLFTHLTAQDIFECLKSLRKVAKPSCRLFGTFFETQEECKNPDVSHSHDLFYYTRHRMQSLGVELGWRPRYIGDWNYPRGQKIIEFLAS